MHHNGRSALLPLQGEQLYCLYVGRERKCVSVCIYKHTQKQMHIQSILKVEVMSLFDLERDQYSKNYFSYIYMQQYITKRNNWFIPCQIQLSFEVTSLASIRSTPKVVLFKVSWGESIWKLPFVFCPSAW